MAAYGIREAGGGTQDGIPAVVMRGTVTARLKQRAGEQWADGFGGELLVGG
jgi:hypothetical protein